MVRSASGEPDKALLCVLAEQAKACFAWRWNGNFPGPACGMRLRPAWGHLLHKNLQNSKYFYGLQVTYTL
jgi:hypothetical protein